MARKLVAFTDGCLTLEEAKELGNELKDFFELNDEVYEEVVNNFVSGKV